MPHLQLLTRSQQAKFDASPNLNSSQRKAYFSLNEGIFKNYLDKMRSPLNQVGFLLQLGYFRASGKFFTNDHFKSADIEFVCSILGYKQIEDCIDMQKYKSSARSDHKKFILEQSGWQKFTSTHAQDLHIELSMHAKQQMHPKLLLPIATDYLIKNKIELPLYYVLSGIVTDIYNKIEDRLVEMLDDCLSNNQKSVLDDLIWINDKRKKTYKYSALAKIKQFSFSTKIASIQDSVETYKLIKAFYIEFIQVYNKLELTEHATNYYSEWVRKSKLFQLKQFRNRSKAYLYLLAHLKHQFFKLTDMYVDIFLKLVRTANSAMDRKIEKQHGMTSREQKKALLKLDSSCKSSKDAFVNILAVLDNNKMGSKDKIDKIRMLIAAHFNSDERKQIENDKTIANILEYDEYVSKRKVELLQRMGASLQRKLTPIICELDFENSNSRSRVYYLIRDFVYNNGKIDKSTNYEDDLSDKEKTVIYRGKSLNVLAYKATLFNKVFNAIKSGELNLRYSYKYLHLTKYLIDDRKWDNHGDAIVTACGLSNYATCQDVVNTLNQTLNERYNHVNTEYKNGNNKYLSFNKSGKFIVSTPKARQHQTKDKLSPIFSQEGLVPIPRVLEEINNATNFTKCFKHHSNKFVVMKPSPKILFAGLLSKGCNHGIIKMANISKGITQSKLNNTINWFFSLENLQNANNSVIEYLNKLSLPNIYKLGDKHSHTSSDGQKFNVGVDSILANYSFKYFGQSQGVSVYSFIDDRQVLFHSTVMSPGEREAAFVIDGLVANNVVRSHIHSTDTHGYSEVIFAVMHLLKVSFAPRIKNLGSQTLYCIDPKKKYSKDDYPIKLDTKVNLKIIEDNWDDILRLVATIKTKTFTASQIFKRLNSYTKELPLYKALKEFGRIIKTIYILTYVDDVLLRQKIEKQLNKIELSNKFGKAVFFANSQEFRVGSTEEQMLIVACRVFIQNCIILWNYLYLSQVLINQNIEDRETLLRTIKSGSVISWRHINLHGEYDFTAANDRGLGIVLELDKIKRLKIDQPVQ